MSERQEGAVGLVDESGAPLSSETIEAEPETKAPAGETEQGKGETKRLEARVETRVMWSDGEDRDLVKLPGAFRAQLYQGALKDTGELLNIHPDVALVTALKGTIERTVKELAPVIIQGVLMEMFSGGNAGLERATPGQLEHLDNLRRAAEKKRKKRIR